MGIPILRKGTDDGCCDCATVTDPCECGPKVTSTCRKRSGTATICGIEPYTPSTPPRRFRRETISGDEVNCSWLSNTTCSGGPLARGGSVYSGTRVIDASTCAETNTRQRAQHNADLPCALGTPTGSTTTITGTFSPSGGSQAVVTSSVTHRNWKYADTCVAAGGGSSFWGGEVDAVLDIEDTEDDAIARSTASWSEWGEADNCCAGIQQRTSGLSFSYAEVEYKLNITGPAGEYVTIEIELLRRPYGSTGPYDPFASVFDAGTLDSEGKRELTGSIPCEVGYETCMGNVSVYNP